MKPRVKKALIGVFLVTVLVHLYTMRIPEEKQRSTRRREPFLMERNEWTIRFAEKNAVFAKHTSSGGNLTNSPANTTAKEGGASDEKKKRVGSNGARTGLEDSLRGEMEFVSSRTDIDQEKVKLLGSNGNGGIGLERHFSDPNPLPTVLPKYFTPRPPRDERLPSMECPLTLFPLVKAHRKEAAKTAETSSRKHTKEVEASHANSTVEEGPEWSDEAEWQRSLVVEDLYHTPLATRHAYAVFAGLHLTFWTPKGLKISLEERLTWKESWRFEQKLVADGQVNDRPLFARELFPHLSEGASLRLHSKYYQLNERYFLQEPLEGRREEDTATPRSAFTPFITNSFCDAFVEMLHLPAQNPLVVDLPYLSQVATFTLQCLYLRTNALRKVVRSFVLVVTDAGRDPPHSHLSSSSSRNTDSEQHFLRATDSFSIQQTPLLAQYPDVTVTYLLDHPLLTHWFSVHGNVKHRYFTSLPIGYLWYHRSDRSLLVPDQGRRQREEERHTLLTKQLFAALNLTKVFYEPFLSTNPSVVHRTDKNQKIPQTTGLRLISQMCLWLEDAQDVFSDGSTSGYLALHSMANLPAPVHTVYIVLVPLVKDTTAPPYLIQSTFNDTIFTFDDSAGKDVSVQAAQHIALLPFTAAVYHKLMQYPYGDPQERKLTILVAGKSGTKSSWNGESPQGALYAHLQEPHAPDLSYVVDEMGTEEWYTALNQFAFVACPIVWSYDSSCIWEALVFGAIPLLPNVSSTSWGTSESYSSSFGSAVPGEERNLEPIISDSVQMDLYDGLPVVFYQSVEQVTNTAWLQEQKNRVYDKAMARQLEISQLFQQTWVKKIYGVKHTRKLIGKRASS